MDQSVIGNYFNQLQASATSLGLVISPIVSKSVIRKVRTYLNGHPDIKIPDKIYYSYDFDNTVFAKFGNKGIGSFNSDGMNYKIMRATKMYDSNDKSDYFIVILGPATEKVRKGLNGYNNRPLSGPAII